MNKLIAALAFVCIGSSAFAVKNGPQVVAPQKPSVLKAYLKNAAGTPVASGPKQWFLQRVSENKSAFRKLTLDPPSSPARRVAYIFKGTTPVNGIRPGFAMIIRPALAGQTVMTKVKLPGAK